MMADSSTSQVLKVEVAEITSATFRPLPPPLTVIQPATDIQMTAVNESCLSRVGGMHREASSKNCESGFTAFKPINLLMHRGKRKRREEGDSSGPLDSVGILQTFNRAMDTIMDKRLKDLEKERLEVSFDVFDKWVEDTGTRRYRPDNPNAVQQKAGWSMQQIIKHGNVTEKTCIGVIVCTTCHVNYLKRQLIATSKRRMKPAYRPPPLERDRIKLAGKRCPEKECGGVLIHTRCRGFFGNPVMHRWHTFNDAIVLESLGIHDHPRPVKDYQELDPSPATTSTPTSLWTDNSTPSIPVQVPAAAPTDLQRIEASDMSEVGSKSGSPTEHSRKPRPKCNTNPSEQEVADDSDVNGTGESSAIGLHEDVYALTTGIVGCLPDNVQRAMKSFSIKPDKQHVTFTFPFMEDIIHQTVRTSNLHHQSGGLYHVTPMLLCDHSLNLIDGFDVVVTLAADVQRSVLCVVHLTIYKNSSKEGIKQHYASLLKIILESLPSDVPLMNHFKLPTFVLLSDDCDPDEIASPLAETLMSVRADDFLAPGNNPNDVILSLKENLILPCIISRPYAFRLSVTNVTSRLPEQDTERFVALAQYLLSDKCSDQEMKKTDALLKDPVFVPTVIRQFWAIWGHELIAPKVFPAAKTLWDSEDAPVEQDKVSTEDTCNNWRSIFRLKCPSERPSFREIIQRLVQVLKEQGPSTEPTISERNEKNPKTSKHHQPIHQPSCNPSNIDIIPDGLTGYPLPSTCTAPASSTTPLFLNNNSILPGDGFEKPAAGTSLNLQPTEGFLDVAPLGQVSPVLANPGALEFNRLTSVFDEPAIPPAPMDSINQHSCSLFCQPSPRINRPPFPFLPAPPGPILTASRTTAPVGPGTLRSHVRQDSLLMVAPSRTPDYFSRVYPPPRAAPYFQTRRHLSLADGRRRIRELRVGTNHTAPNIGLGLL